jgi:hypothetical protein
VVDASTGEEVHRDVAAVVITNRSVIGVGDYLFGECLAQTWRYVEPPA